MDEQAKDTEAEAKIEGAKPEINLDQVLQSERAWEYILLDVVKSEELDPWDIDITKLTQTYLERIKKMRELDLRIPARVILATALLLKMQSATMVSTAAEDHMFEELFGENEEVPSEEPEQVPLLDLRVQRKPLRKITLSDLIKTLQDAMEKAHRDRREKFPHGVAFNLPEIDISDSIEALYNKILNTQSQKIAFSSLLAKQTADAIINTLMPLLHLANEQKIDLEQQRFFEEIYILKQQVQAAPAT